MQRHLLHIFCNIERIFILKVFKAVKIIHNKIFLQSGLTEASRQSSISVQEAERQVLNFVSKHVHENRSPLAGNSVYMDRLFLRKYMPKLDSYLHYRLIDVSTIKELAKRWYPQEFSRIPSKKFEHRCMNDILESVEELKYYRGNIFKKETLKE